MRIGNTERREASADTIAARSETPTTRPTFQFTNFTRTPQKNKSFPTHIHKSKQTHTHTHTNHAKHNRRHPRNDTNVTDETILYSSDVRRSIPCTYVPWSGCEEIPTRESPRFVVVFYLTRSRRPTVQTSRTRYRHEVQCVRQRVDDPKMIPHVRRRRRAEGRQGGTDRWS